MASYDLMIRNGFIVDGSGNPGYRGDVAVSGDRIASIATHIEGDAAREIDAAGNVVAPGFIDPHAHMEIMALTNPTMEEYAYQGVSTIVSGNCGHSVTPYGADTVREYMYRNGLIGPQQAKLEVQWDDFDGYQQAVRDTGGTTINQATLLGHGTIRWAVMKGAHERPPSPVEMKEMKRLVAQGLEQGAVGMSTGLDYIPSSYSNTSELVEISTVLAEHDAVYASHLRNKWGFVEAVREALEIGRRAGCRVQVSHLNMSAVDAYDEILEARDRGLEVGIDTIPASTGHVIRKDRMIQFLMTLSPEYFDKTLEEVRAAMQTAEGRAKFREDDFMLRQPKDQVFVVNTSREDWEGRSVADLAKEAGVEPDDYIFDLMLSDEELAFWMGRWRGNTDRPHAPESILNPLLGPGADIILVDRLDPRSWYEPMRAGTFPIFFQLARKSGVRLEQIVRRCTSLPAQTFRLRGRGLLTEGKQADIVVLDLANYDYPNQYTMDYSDPLKLATGVNYLVVNGTPVLDGGKLVDGARPGRQLKRGE